MTAPKPSSLVVVAGGSSRRMGGTTAKQFLDLEGRSVLIRTLDAFSGLEWITERIVVVSESVVQEISPERRSPIELDAIETTPPLVRDLVAGKVDRIATGGNRRQDSVLAGLMAIRADNDFVLIHDAARPFATRELIERVATAAFIHGGAIPATAVTATVKRIDSKGMVEATLPRDVLRLAQTPQAFRTRDLLDAYKRFGECDVTDDAAMFELARLAVAVVEGDEDNIKITSPADIARAHEILKRKGGA